MKNILRVFLFATIALCVSQTNAQWVQTTLNQSTVNCFAVSGGNLFAGTNNGIFLSTDNGANWSAVNSGLTSTVVYALAVSDTNLFAGTGSAGVFRSTNNGLLWTAASQGIYDTSVYCLVGNGTNLFAGTNRGVFRSTNNGADWERANYNIPFPIRCLLINGGNLFAGAWCSENLFCDGGICVTSNNGSSWRWCDGTLGRGFAALIASGSNIYAGAGFELTGWMGGVFRSTDSGTNWIQIDSSYHMRDVRALAVSGTSLFVAKGWPEGVFLTTNNGIRWDAVGTGLGTNSVRSLAVLGTNLFAGTWGRGVWRRPLSEMITSVDPELDELPQEFLLAQNYPNPFNPNTTIEYALPERSVVTLKIYNTLGQQMTTLVQGEKEAGSHEVRFDAAGLPSGVYFYRLTAGAFTETRRMLLMK